MPLTKRSCALRWRARRLAAPKCTEAPSRQAVLPETASPQGFPATFFRRLAQDNAAISARTFPISSIVKTVPSTKPVAACGQVLDFEPLPGGGCRPILDRLNQRSIGAWKLTAPAVARVVILSAPEGAAAATALCAALTNSQADVSRVLAAPAAAATAALLAGAAAAARPAGRTVLQTVRC